MNKKQRNKNRKTAEELSLRVKPDFKCIECGEKTKFGHFVHSTGFGDGFWICNKFYGADGKRIGC